MDLSNRLATAQLTMGGEGLAGGATGTAEKGQRGGRDRRGPKPSGE